jgi:hypothetical protein
MSETAAPPAPATPPPAGIDVRDAAWARVPTRLDPESIARELADAEVLLRLNPYYYFKSCRRTGPDSWHAEFENHSNQQQLTLDIDVTPGPVPGVTVNYRQGIKRRTLFTIEPGAQGATLVVTDDYSGTTEEERKQREAEVDKSLLAWGEALRVYFIRLQRYSRIPGWRGYIRRLWIPMKPSARRIVWMLYLITLVEFFFFCFVVLIWWVEHHK